MCFSKYIPWKRNTTFKLDIKLSRVDSNTGIYIYIYMLLSFHAARPLWKCNNANSDYHSTQESSQISYADLCWSKVVDAVYLCGRETQQLILKLEESFEVNFWKQTIAELFFCLYTIVGRVFRNTSYGTNANTKGKQVNKCISLAKVNKYYDIVWTKQVGLNENWQSKTFRLAALGVRDHNESSESSKSTAQYVNMKSPPQCCVVLRDKN